MRDLPRRRRPPIIRCASSQARPGAELEVLRLLPDDNAFPPARSGIARRIVNGDASPGGPLRAAIQCQARARRASLPGALPRPRRPRRAAFRTRLRVHPQQPRRRRHVFVAARLAMDWERLTSTLFGMSGGLSLGHAALGHVREELVDIARRAEVDDAEVGVPGGGHGHLAAVAEVGAHRPREQTLARSDEVA
jgi:hypothetical protein